MRNICHLHRRNLFHNGLNLAYQYISYSVAHLILSIVKKKTVEENFK